MFSRILRVMTVIGILVNISTTAHSGTMQIYGGTLNASLKLYDFYNGYMLDGTVSEEKYFLRKEYILGTDFIAGVPGTLTLSSMTAYSASSGILPNTAYWTPHASPLDDACTTATTDGVYQGISVATRGTCTFLTKWSNMEARGQVGGILVNNVSGLTGMGGIDDSVSIPFFLVTQEVWSELFLGSDLMDENGELFGKGVYYPLITMDVSWTPNSQIPEPASLALFGLGLAGLCVMRRRKQ